MKGRYQSWGSSQAAAAMRVATTGEPACARSRGHGSAAAAGIGKASTSHDTQANRNFVTWAAVIAACILLASAQPNEGRRRVRSSHDEHVGAASDEPAGHLDPEKAH